MSLWKKLGSVLRGGARSSSAGAARDGMRGKATDEEKGLLVFHNTSEVIRAERVLAQAGIRTEVMGPPPDLRSGCDMVLVFPLIFELPVRNALARARLEPLQAAPLRDLLLEPVSLFQAVRYGRYLMVRAANMKMTIDIGAARSTGDAQGREPGNAGHGAGGRIVNISGGGCPDVPYLASLLVGRLLNEADEPRMHGRTLCSYALQKAFEETRRLLTEAKTDSLPDHSMDGEDRGGEMAMVEEVRSPLFEERRPGRPWLICGAVPDADFPLSLGHWTLRGDQLTNAATGAALPVRRGTPALLAAALAACEALGVPGPEALLVGDEGDGEGSRALYRHLADELLPSCRWAGLTFHYLFPDVDGHNRMLMALDGLPASVRPLLVADAGSMYVAKMSGYAARYDLFTPDAGELAFLADEKAPHPFYTRGFLLATERDVPSLVARAVEHGNSARHLLVKGAVDYVIREGVTLATVGHPLVPAMEPIGGTGDLVTGLATAWLAAGFGPADAGLAACRCNRAVGRAARPCPATGVAELLPFIPRAVQTQR